MEKTSHLAQSNRKKNTGGPYPEASRASRTLVLFLRKLSKVVPHYRPSVTIVALHCWLTQQLPAIKDIKDIPDLIRLSGSEPCRENGFRNFNDGTTSWCEFALPCQYRKTTIYQWQPVPIQFNAVFQSFISTQPYHQPFLDEKGKRILLKLISNSWKTPPKFITYRLLRKDRFFKYMTHCIQADNTLPAAVSAQVLESKDRHHRSARAYQCIDSDQLRYKVFDAYNRYIARIIRFASNANLHPYFTVFLKKQSINLITDKPPLAGYLQNTGRIIQYRLDMQEKRRMRVAVPSIQYGSRRVVDETDVSVFFAQLHRHIQNVKPKRRADKQAFIHCYNQATYRIALLFIALSGARPTHSISLQRCFYGGHDIAFIQDKGRLRILLISDYLKEEIQRFLKFQEFILSLLPQKHSISDLWFLVDTNDHLTPLTNKLLRQFMNAFWPGVVPYQLRHYFAQRAMNSQLLAHDIDRLMGHSNFGEHLGSDNLFPSSYHTLQQHLNQLSTALGLEEMHYV